MQQFFSPVIAVAFRAIATGHPSFGVVINSRFPGRLPAFVAWRASPLLLVPYRGILSTLAAKNSFPSPHRAIVKINAAPAMVALDIGIPFSHKLNFKTSGTIIKKVPPARSQEQSSLVRGHYFNKKNPPGSRRGMGRREFYLSQELTEF